MGNICSGSITINSITKFGSRCLNNASITVNATSPGSQIMYSIISGPATVSPQSSNVFNSLAAGTYIVKVENLLGESTTQSVDISSAYKIIEFNQLINHASCNGANDGKVIGNPTPFTGVKSFTWKLKNIASGQLITQIDNDTFKNLAPGDYTLTVTDSCLNTTVHNFEIKSGFSGFVSLNSSFIKTDCNTVEVSSSFVTKEASFPIKIKYEYNNLIVEKTPIPNNSNFIKDIFNISAVSNGVIKITLYNACGDSIKQNAYFQKSYINTCSQLINCNSAKIKFMLGSSFNFQIVKVISNQNSGKLVFNNPPIINNVVEITLPSFVENEMVDYMLITNCNDTISLFHAIPSLSRLITRFPTTIGSKCNQNNYSFLLNDCDLTVPPVNAIFYDMNNKVLANYSSSNNKIEIKDYPSGVKYYIKIKNGCNKEYVDTFLWESDNASPMFDVEKRFAENCLDSTISIGLSFNRTKGEPKLISFTGPPVLSSLKPKYSYRDSMDLKKFESSQRFTYYGLGVGKYSITIKDSCESHTEIFEVFPSDVSNNFYSYQAIKACEDNNKLILNLYSKHTDANKLNKLVTGFYSIYNLKTNKYLNDDPAIAFSYKELNAKFQKNDTFKYLNEGKYVLSIRYRKDTYTENIDYDRTVTNKIFCSDIIDTLIIPPYSRPNVKTVVKIHCGTQTWVEIIPDTSFGIFPYKFEVNKGPELFPVQSSNIFKINIMGNYQAKIWDTCGNANTVDFSVDTVKFNKIYINDSTCKDDSAILAYQASPYFTYRWIKPNGTVFIGDTLKINPIILSDVGKYKVTKFVNFKGCKDSFKIDYSLNKYRKFHRYDTIKDGDTFYYKGTIPIIKEGTITETIPMLPCDSLFLQHLYVIDTYLIFPTVREICNGDSTYYRGKYYTQSGEYRDTVDVFKYADSVFYLKVILYPKSIWRVLTNSNITCNSKNDGIINVTSYSQYSPFKYFINNIPSNNGGYFYNLPPGTYNIKIQNSLGCIQDTFFTLTQPDKLILEAFPEMNPIDICTSTKLITTIRYVNGGQLPPLTYKWSPSLGLSCSDCTSPVFSSYSSQKYVLEVKDTNNCQLKAEIDMTVNGVDELFIPKIFTPNQDGQNDQFKVNGNCLLSIKLSIFNRWGLKVYHTDDIEKGWNGKYYDVPCPIGVYTYIAEVVFLNGKKTIKSGEFLLAK